MKTKAKILIGFSVAILCALIFSEATRYRAQAASATVLQINAAKVTGNVSPMLYGYMTEEINYSYDGGLYAELVRNRAFKEDAKQPVHWQLVEEGGGTGSMALDPEQPFNNAIQTSLRLTVTQASGKQRVGIANIGFWGIPVKPATSYRASFYAKAAAGFTGPLTVALISNDGTATHASAQVPRITGGWQKYQVTLTTGKLTPSAGNRLVITASSPGTVWFGFVSLFPPSYKNRPNGNRPDIMEILAGLKPAFLRFPGGNYLEGNTLETRFDWRKTIGDVSQRPGHKNDAWGYWSSDGMGLLEFLEWCEDLNIKPVLGLYAGYSLRQQRVKPGLDLEPYIQEALDEIEYVMGSRATPWGAKRAKDGHPAPFKLEYVEIGNEDNFDREAGSYEGRFAQFYDAIRKHYPKLRIISSTSVPGRAPDIIDEHYYRRSEDEMASHAHDYDARPRTGPKVFVGEYATRVGVPTPNMSAALGDAAWIVGMERNSDLVVMSSYAPLFVNVNKGAMQWQTDLIGYDALSSYGSPAYYVQKMFSLNHGDTILATTAQSVPTRAWQPPSPRGRAASPQPAAQPAQEVPLLFFNATRDTKSGTIYVKVVNRDSTTRDVRFQLEGVTGIQPKGQVVALAGSGPEDTNSITQPVKIVPVTAAVDGLSADFTRSFPPYSVNVLLIKAN
jgi:alpha-N-arabinofuranosidase